jgi:hypothetical protein
MIRPIPKDLYLGMHINESHVLGLTLVLLCKGGSTQPEDVLQPRRCAPKPNPNPKPKPNPNPNPNPNLTLTLTLILTITLSLST